MLLRLKVRFTLWNGFNHAKNDTGRLILGLFDSSSPFGWCDTALLSFAGITVEFSSILLFVFVLLQIFPLQHITQTIKQKRTAHTPITGPMTLLWPFEFVFASVFVLWLTVEIVWLTLLVIVDVSTNKVFSWFIVSYCGIEFLFLASS